MRSLVTLAMNADRLIQDIADQFNGNAARRLAIRQRLQVAMLATERHHLVAARAATLRTARLNQRSALLHWRIAFHRHAV